MIPPVRMQASSLLASVVSPQAVRNLPPEQLPELASDIRRYLIQAVCATGGHLGSNLGVVELTIALHRVFQSPHDRLIFDIGHQAYVHKLLTGRQAGFGQLRQAGGLSGYLSRNESEHDIIENSHASTALSYADGLAKARSLREEADHAVIAVIGDGALTGGMAWEALDNIAAAPHRPVIIVLNDNGRSYAPTTGSIAARLAGLRNDNPRAAQVNNPFTSRGLQYIGPIDGHDIPALEEALRQARHLDKPVIVHVVTVKGKGYPQAEADQADCFHTVGVIDPATGGPRAAESPSPEKAFAPPAASRSYTDVFSNELRALARTHEKLVAITAAMLRPTGLHLMAEEFPHRVFDVGIAEQHAVTSAAGLAMGGFHPVVAIYATFLNRAFDQVLMDVALHQLPVTFVLDRAGITGPDGPSHHGMWDLSLLALVPGMRVAAPRDAATLKVLLSEAVDTEDGPTALRLHKTTAAEDIPAIARMDQMDILYRTAHHPLDVLLVTTGTTVLEGLEAARQLSAVGIGVTVIDPRWIIPVNSGLVHLAARHRLTVTLEDNTRTGGFGSLLAQACTDCNVTTPVKTLGLPRDFIAQGTRSALLVEAGLTAPGITAAIRKALAHWNLTTLSF